MEETVNNSEDIDFSNDSNQSYESDMSPEKINRSFFFLFFLFLNEEYDCSDDGETESGIWMKYWSCFPFIGKPGLNVKIQKIH